MMLSETSEHLTTTFKWAKTEDILALLETTKGNTLLDLRDRAAILFLTDTGCRASELCSLKVYDLDLDAMQAVVSNISTRARYVFFGELTKVALKRWLDVRPSDCGPWVFIRLAAHSKRTLTSSSLCQMLKRRGKAAGCKGPVNPRAFRHAFARNWVLNGGNLETLTYILGHTSDRVTRSSYDISKANVARWAKQAWLANRPPDDQLTIDLSVLQ
jgi:integrase/recombinase XerD